MPAARSSLISATLFATTLGLWLAFGDGSLWRTVAVTVGAGLIAWSLRRTLQTPPAAQQAPVDQLAAAAPRRMTRLPRDVRCRARHGRQGRRQLTARRSRG